MKFTTALAALALSAATTLVNAAPFKTARDIWDPKVTFPTAGSVLVSGQTYTVTWDTSDQPAHITNTNGIITLNFGNVGTPVVLADGFDIRDGHHDITIPRVFTEGDYSIDLWGDSGNWSEKFQIVGVTP
ncbi:hypothetical protein PsYK624_125680 [Phanerochaete sordida]|uniref:Yeast cell wall synthesis Kre9/Knh1-like N-terminal domain-containing protein n=1 Tax=Phanerochaete sordida TaxID=48140 RepID=A0A9P3LIP1_9APHY|nr:hypothetical protein PsYK624_125680 [Phanerochaete sordida]